MRPFFVVLAFAGLLSSHPATAQNGPVVVELYTSQGCSSCPPADALLHDLGNRDDVIALALHVDYWDYIGWADSFAQPAFTARQHAYARARNAEMVFTPQMIINGQDSVVGSRTMQVVDAIQAHRAQGNAVQVSMQRNGESVTITATPTARGDYLVQLVRYTPAETVQIRRGENAGHAYNYAHIVNAWNVIHRWDGADALAIEVSAAGTDPAVAIIQHANNGAIVGAAELR